MTLPVGTLRLPVRGSSEFEKGTPEVTLPVPTGKEVRPVPVENSGRVPEGPELDGVKPVDATPEGTEPDGADPEGAKPVDGSELDVRVRPELGSPEDGKPPVPTGRVVGAEPVKMKPVPDTEPPVEISVLATTNPDGTLAPDEMSVLSPLEFVNGTKLYGTGPLGSGID